MSAQQELFQKTKLSVEDIINCFYKQNHKEGFDKLNQNLGNISELTYYILQYNKDTMNAVTVEQEINTMLYKLMNAIEQKDVIVLTDTLKYELFEYFNKFYEPESSV